MKGKDELKQEVEKIEKSKDLVKEYIQDFQEKFNKLNNLIQVDTKVLKHLFYEYI